jgi:hypothetical protein
MVHKLRHAYIGGMCGLTFIVGFTWGLIVALVASPWLVIGSPVIGAAVVLIPTWVLDRGALDG